MRWSRMSGFLTVFNYWISRIALITVQVKKKRTWERHRIPHDEQTCIDEHLNSVKSKTVVTIRGFVLEATDFLVSAFFLSEFFHGSVCS